MYGVRFFALEIAFSEHRDAKVLEKLVNSFNFLKRLYRFHTNYFYFCHLSVRGETWRQNSRRVNVPGPGPSNAHSAVPNIVAAHVAVPKTAENDGAQNHD